MDFSWPISALSVLRMISGLLPRSEPYTHRLEAILLLHVFIVTYAINIYILAFNFDLNNADLKLRSGKND